MTEDQLWMARYMGIWSFRYLHYTHAHGQKSPADMEMIDIRSGASPIARCADWLDDQFAVYRKEHGIVPGAFTSGFNTAFDEWLPKRSQKLYEEKRNAESAR